MLLVAQASTPRTVLQSPVQSAMPSIDPYTGKGAALLSVRSLLRLCPALLPTIPPVSFSLYSSRSLTSSVCAALSVCPN